MPPKLTRTSVTIGYSSDDGYRSETKFSAKQEQPEANILYALEELARLTALFGFEQEALQVFNDARSRVQAFKEKR